MCQTILFKPKEKPTQATLLGLNHVMLGGDQGLDYCKTKHRHIYTNTWIIARMSTRRRILVVFMGLAIGCLCQIITSSWRMNISNYHSIAKLSVQLNQHPFS